MTYKLLTRNKIYPHDWEICVWESDTIENLSKDECIWWWRFLVYDIGLHPRIFRVVSNDFDLSTLNPTHGNGYNESYHIKRGMVG
tara:strand:- start:382 stop:636 length:255 start_codon:yes stop_codon:yes gene_type:complete